MKFLVLFLATAAVAAASVINVNRNGLSNEVGQDSIYEQGYNGIYSRYPIWNQFGRKNFWQQKYGKGVFDNEDAYEHQAFYNHPIYGSQEYYGQDVQQLVRTILFRIFDKQVLVNIFNEYGYQQNWSQDFLDNILETRGIFDYQVLMQLIQNPVLRNVLVREGIFDKEVLQRILYSVDIQGSYSYSLFEHLVNKVVLKKWFYNLGFHDKNTFYQFFNRRSYDNAFHSYEVGQEWLIQVVNNPELRSFLVQQGVFNGEILKQILYVQKSQNVYDEQLVRQLINKQVLKNFFIQHGFVDYQVLNQFLSNEIYGLKVFLRLQLHQQTPDFLYRQQVGKQTYVPEHVFDQVQELPVGGNFVGIELRKSIVKPIRQTVGDLISHSYRNQRIPSESNYLGYFNGDRTNYLSRFNFGQQGQKSYGKEFTTNFQLLSTEFF